MSMKKQIFGIPSKNTLLQIENFVCCLGQADKMGILLFCILLPTVISQPSKKEKVTPDLGSPYKPFGISSQSNIGFGRIFAAEKSTTLNQEPSVNFSRSDNNCTGKNSRNTEENGTESFLDNFIFHKVDLESPFDPFTKRPYHRTILAMRVSPDSKKPLQNDSHRDFPRVADDLYLPHYYFIFNNKSVKSRREQPVIREPLAEHHWSKRPRYGDNSLNKEEFPHEANQNKRIEGGSRRGNLYKLHRRKHPHNLRRKNLLHMSAIRSKTDKIDADMIEWLKNEKHLDSEQAWVYSYLDEKSKINTFEKQLSFLHRWLSRLDRRESKKNRDKQKKKEASFQRQMEEK